MFHADTDFIQQAFQNALDTSMQDKRSSHVKDVIDTALTTISYPHPTETQCFCRELNENGTYLIALGLRYVVKHIRQQGKYGIIKNQFVYLEDNEELQYLRDNDKHTVEERTLQSQHAPFYINQMTNS